MIPTIPIENYGYEPQRVDMFAIDAHMNNEDLINYFCLKLIV